MASSHPETELEIVSDSETEVTIGHPRDSGFRSASTPTVGRGSLPATRREDRHDHAAVSVSTAAPSAGAKPKIIGDVPSVSQPLLLSSVDLNMQTGRQPSGLLRHGVSGSGPEPDSSRSAGISAGSDPSDWDARYRAIRSRQQELEQELRRLSFYTSPHQVESADQRTQRRTTHVTLPPVFSMDNRTEAMAVGDQASGSIGGDAFTQHIGTVESLRQPTSQHSASDFRHSSSTGRHLPDVSGLLTTPVISGRTPEYPPEPRRVILSSGNHRTEATAVGEQASGSTGGDAFARTVGTVGTRQPDLQRSASEVRQLVMNALYNTTDVSGLKTTPAYSGCAPDEHPQETRRVTSLLESLRRQFVVNCQGQLSVATHPRPVARFAAVEAVGMY